jgi:hypothetical protein
MDYIKSVTTLPKITEQRMFNLHNGANLKSHEQYSTLIPSNLNFICYYGIMILFFVLGRRHEYARKNYLTLMFFKCCLIHCIEFILFGS